MVSIFKIGIYIVFITDLQFYHNLQKVFHKQFLSFLCALRKRVTLEFFYVKQKSKKIVKFFGFQNYVWTGEDFQIVHH